jgi:hypothetical protein
MAVANMILSNTLVPSYITRLNDEMEEGGEKRERKNDGP